MSFADATIARLPRSVQPFAERHHELIKFAIVGATTFVIDSALACVDGNGNLFILNPIYDYSFTCIQVLPIGVKNCVVFPEISSIWFTTHNSKILRRIGEAINTSADHQLEMAIDRLEHVACDHELTIAALCARITRLR